MKVQYGALQSPKPGSTAAQCEDAFAYSVPASIAAVCDGAGTAFESRRWASLLAAAFVQGSPNDWTASAILDWVDSISPQWSQSIPWAELSPFEEPKARQGSAATLVGLQFRAPSPRETTGTWRCLAMGDSCLFHISQDRLAAAMPLRHSANFGVHPPLLSTKRSVNEKHIDKLITRQGTWRAGDTFLLMTDAIAEWFLRESEQGTAPWGLITQLDEEEFSQFVQERQTQRLIRLDDVTAFMIGVGVPLGTQRIPVSTVAPPVRWTSEPRPSSEPAGRETTTPALPDRTEPERIRPGMTPLTIGSGRTTGPAGPGSRDSGGPGHPGPRPGPGGPGQRQGTAGPGQRPRPGQRQGPAAPGRSAPRSRPPGGQPNRARRRTIVLGGALVVLVVIAAFALRSLGGGAPAPSKHGPRSSTSARTVAERFAEALATYSIPGKGVSVAGRYQAYLDALGAYVAGHNAAMISQLTGLYHAPPGSLKLHSSAKLGHVTIVRSTRSTVTLYVVVNQQVSTTSEQITVSRCPPHNTSRHACPSKKARTHLVGVLTNTPRTLLLYLVLTRHPGQNWMVSSGQTSLIDRIAAVGGALSAVIAPAQQHQATPSAITPSPSMASAGPLATESNR